jgi:hypothetical protein
LRAPQDNGGKLIEPPLWSAAALVKRNRAATGRDQVQLHGRSLADLAASARRDLLRAAWQYTKQYRDFDGPEPAADTTPLFIAGHQPQLFHPGVWFKNFVLSGMAAEHRGVAVNLVIDSDTIKSAKVRVPGGSIPEPSVEQVAFDDTGPEIPYEERAILNRELLHTFGPRACSRIAPLVPRPLLCDFWPLVQARARECSNLGECLSQARHQHEGQWQSQSLELPQSRIGDFEAFHWFAAHLIARAAELREIYNAAAAEYRRVNHVRNAAHPVPNLAVDGEWIESPLWIWDKTNPRRRRVFVRTTGDKTLLSDRDGLEVAFDLSADGDAQRAVEQLSALQQRGIKLRTRALITTMFARVMLGDLFVHGIGGAKYDQVTDAIIARFLGLEAPAYLTATATLRLPIPHHPVSTDDATRALQDLRELEFHPERYLTGRLNDPTISDIVTAKKRWITTPATRENARIRCRAIREANEALQPHLAERRADLFARRDFVDVTLPGATLLNSREYAFCLYPADPLKKLFGA